MKQLFFIFLSINVLCLNAQTNVDTIFSEINFLASDELNGRETGSEEALKSAEWIAEKFEEFGLKSPEWATDYLQKFTLVKSTILIQNLELNQQQVNAEDFIALSSQTNFQLNDVEAIKIIRIGEKDDFMTQLSNASSSDSSVVVLINPYHSRHFKRIKQYLSRPKYILGDINKKFSIWILSDQETIFEIKLQASNKIEEKKGYNVIGVLPGGKSEDHAWIYSAHYDHIGIIEPVNGDSIANGANDDASGVVAIIELARRFSIEKTNEKPLWFIAFSAEELGLFGSKYLAQNIDINLIEGMINIEMIGFPNEALGRSSAYITGFDLSYWPTEMSKTLPLEDFMFFPDPYPQMQLFTRSDNASFARMGIAAHSISTYSENDTTYHNVNDDIYNIDIENMKIVIDAIYKASLPLLEPDYDPGKIDYKTKTDR